MGTKKLVKRGILIQSILDELYPDPAVPLNHKDPYTLLIAVLLSAQCTDVRVNSVTPQLFQLADTPQKMVQLNPDTIQTIIKPCGLSQRKALAIFMLSKILFECYGGEVPNDFEALERLPGVGHKTASVVMCQAFKVPAFPVDTHIFRLANRWGLSQSKNVKQTEADLKSIFPIENWNKLHLQFIYYGREYCSARKHEISNCRICQLFNVSET